jgi:integral membrane protein
MSTHVSTKNTGFTPRKLYFILAIAEACTWTLLITGLILRATTGIDQTLFTTIGGLHGFVFISYGAASILIAFNQRWGFWVGLLAVITAILPYATIPFELVQAKRGALEGPWRTQASDDPRDEQALDRLFRWFLARPVLLILVIVLAIVAVFSTLLFLGSPGGN